jgi:hypothetical protein
MEAAEASPTRPAKPFRGLARITHWTSSCWWNRDAVLYASEWSLVRGLGGSSGRDFGRRSPTRDASGLAGVLVRAIRLGPTGLLPDRRTPRRPTSGTRSGARPRRPQLAVTAHTFAHATTKRSAPRTCLRGPRAEPGTSLPEEDWRRSSGTADSTDAKRLRRGALARARRSASANCSAVFRRKK